MKKWKKLSSKLLLDHPRLTVYEDKIVLPSGLKSDYLHFGKARDSAMVIAINDTGKILLQKEYSYPPDEWLYQFPGGAINASESPIQGARRELAEEASIDGTLKQIGWFYTDVRRKRDKLYVFTAKNIKPARAQKDIEEEFIDYWLTTSEIRKLISNGKIINSTLLAGWAMFSEFQKYL
jgi:ADP-ribose pyrophosphatase